MKKKPAPAPTTAMLQDLEVEAYFKDCVTLNDLAIDEEFVRVAADVAYWNARYTEALRAYLMQEHNTRLLRDQAKLEEREKLWSEREGLKGKAGQVMEDEVKSVVNLRPDVQEADLALIEAEVEKEKMRRYADAVATKKDALQSLGARLRAEIERDASVRSRYLHGRDVDRGAREDT